METPTHHYYGAIARLSHLEEVTALSTLVVQRGDVHVHAECPDLLGTDG